MNAVGGEVAITWRKDFCFAPSYFVRECERQKETFRLWFCSECLTRQLEKEVAGSSLLVLELEFW